MPENKQKDFSKLETVAERIFASDIRVIRGYSAEEVARRAFQKAQAFCVVADAVRGGEQILPLATSEEQLHCLVDVWDGGKGQFGEVMHDANGKTIQEIMPVDRWSFARNLPEGHPVNQRYVKNAIKNRRICTPDGRILTDKELESKGLVEAASKN